MLGLDSGAMRNFPTRLSSTPVRAVEPSARNIDGAVGHVEQTTARVTAGMMLQRDAPTALRHWPCPPAAASSFAKLHCGTSLARVVDLLPDAIAAPS